MAARGVMPDGLVASTLPDHSNDLVDDQDGGENGEKRSIRKRTRRLKSDAEKGRSRNLVIPDSLYDQLYLYARKTKVKIRDERRVNGRIEPAIFRSLTVSEAACEALAKFLPRGGLSIVEGEQSAS
jgi:hypothetical protein